MLKLPIRLIIYVVLFAFVLTGFVEAACRTDRYDFSQEWRVRYEASPWQSATPIQNCRINLRHQMQNTLQDFALALLDEWSPMDDWYQILAASIAAIFGVATLDLIFSALLVRKKRKRPTSLSTHDKHDVRARARRRL